MGRDPVFSTSGGENVEKEWRGGGSRICIWASRWWCPTVMILGVFDLDNASWAYKTREFLERAEQAGRVVWLGDDLPLPSLWW